MTVVSERAGLVMYPEAKVKLHGAQIGHVSSIEPLSGGRAALHLAIDPDAMNLIPANVSADIASSTVFGSKFVELVPPKNPSAESAKAGQVVEGDHVTVELNTVFEQLVSVLSKVDPAKLNETVGAITKALNGRGEVRTDADQPEHRSGQGQPEPREPESRTRRCPRRSWIRMRRQHLTFSPPSRRRRR